MTGIELTAAQVFWIQVAVTTASIVYQRARARKLAAAAEKQADAQRGFQLVTENSISPIPVVYGRALVGGTRVFHKVSESYVYAAPGTGGDMILSTGDVRSPPPDGTAHITAIYFSKADTANEQSLNYVLEGLSITGTIIGSILHFSLVDGTAANYDGKTVQITHDTVTSPYTFHYNGGDILAIMPVEQMAPFTPSLNENVSGTKNEFLFVQQVICRGGINHIYWADVDGADFNDVKFKYGQRLHIYPNGGADPMATANGIAPTNRFMDCAYASMVFRLDRKNPEYNNIPVAQFYMEGMKVKDIGGSPGDYFLTEEKAYSNNPALCLLDYLTSASYGRGLSLDKIDLESFYFAKKVCEVVMLSDKTPYGKLWLDRVKLSQRDVNRFECNLTLDTSAPLVDNIEIILQTMNGAELIWSAGKYKLQLRYPQPWIAGGWAYNSIVQHGSGSAVDIYRSTVGDNTAVPGGVGVTTWVRDVISAYITDDDLDRNDTPEISWPNRQQRLNFATVKFLNESKDFKEDSRAWPLKTSLVYSTYLNDEDYGMQLEKETFATGCTDEWHASQIAEEMVRSSRSGTVYKFSVMPKFANLEPGDYIKLQSSVLGIPGELMKIEEIKLNERGTATIQAVKFDASQLAWNAPDDEIVPDRNVYDYELGQASVITYNETFVTQESAGGILSWVKANDNRVNHYRIMYTTATVSEVAWDTVWTEVGNVIGTRFETPRVHPGVYTVAVVACGDSGRQAPQWSYKTGSKWPVKAVDIGSLEQVTDLAFSDIPVKAKTSGVLTWTAPADIRVTQYKVLYTVDAIGDVDEFTVWEELGITTDTKFYTPSVPNGTYTLAVASMSPTTTSHRSGWPVIEAVITSTGIPDVNITADNYIFVTPSGSDTPAPTTLPLVAITTDIISPTFAWYLDGVLQAETSDTYNIDSFAATSAKLVRVEVTTDFGDIVWDDMTILSLKEGSDSVVLHIDNENRTISCDSDGNPKAGTLPIHAQITVFMGIVDITNESFVAYSTSSQSGFAGTAAIDSTGYITISSLTAEFGSARFVAAVTIGATTIYPSIVFHANKSSDGVPALGAENLILDANRWYWVFPNATSTDSGMPPILFHTKLVNITGTVDYTAEAFDIDDVSLGTVTLTESSPDATMSNAQFVTHAGTKYVIVTATCGSLSDTMWIESTYNGSDGIVMHLTNPTHPVQTDSGGGSGIFTNATTSVFIYEGINDTTSTWSFSIAATDCTATINSGAGPVSGTGTVSVHVSAMADDNAKVVITATRDGFSIHRDFVLHKSRAGFDGTTAVTLSLQANRFYFIFEDKDATTSTSGNITFKTKLQNITGTPDYTAIAYDFNGSILSPGTITLDTTVLGTAAEPVLTVTNFNTYSNTNTYYVKVTSTLGSLSDTMTVYRGNNGSNTVTMYLTNPAHNIPTNSAGGAGDYVNAETDVHVYRGTTEETSLWTFSRSDTDCTSLINGVVGPVSGTSSVTVSVTDIDQDSAFVLIQGTKSGSDPIQQVFSLARARAGLDGSSAPDVRLKASNGIVFVTPTNSAIPVPATTTFTAVTRSITTPVFTWYLNGSVISGETSSTLVVDSFPAGDPNKEYKVVVTGGSITVDDTEFVYSIKEGDSAFNAGIEDASRHVICDAAGTPLTTGSGLPISAQFSVVQGAAYITTGHGIVYSLQSSSGLGSGGSVPTIGSSDGVIGITTITADQGTAVFRAAVPLPDGGYQNFDRNFHVAKVREGAVGPSMRLKSKDTHMVFANESATTTTWPAIEFEAVLTNLSGTVTWSAIGYDISNTSTGTVTVSYTGNTATLSATQFVNSLGTVNRYVEVTATLGSLIETIRIIRGDQGSSNIILEMFNPGATVSTAADGTGGDYSAAHSAFKVWKGTVDVTASWLFAVASTTGMTYNINGTAGPTSGISSGAIDVAVTAMSVDLGSVTVTASKSGETDLVKQFTVIKSKAGSMGEAYTFAFTPKDIITLPVDQAGVVTTYSDAWTDYKITKNGTDVTLTDGWTLTPSYDNVAGTFSSAKIAVTALYDGNYVDYGTAMTGLLPSGWNGWGPIIHGGGVYVMHGAGIATANTSEFLVTSDWQTFTTKSVTASKRGSPGAGDYMNGTFVIMRSGIGSNASYDYSTDGGSTWNTGTLPVSDQWTRCFAFNGKFLAANYNNQTAYLSTTGLTGSWSTTITLPMSPGNNFYFAYANGRLLYHDYQDYMYYSTDDGATWSSNQISHFPVALGAVPDQYIISEIKVFQNKFIALLQNTDNRVCVSSDGVNWTTVILPRSVNQPVAHVLNGKIFIRGGSSTYYNLVSHDGYVWYDSNPSVQASNQWAPLYGAVPTTNFNPVLLTSSLSAYKATYSNSNSGEGSVTITASKSGQTTQARTVRVVKGAYKSEVITSNVYPGYWVFPATADGVVTSFTGATFGLQIFRNGVDETSAWTIDWKLAGAGMASTAGIWFGTGNNIPILAMGNATDTGSLTFTASKAGEVVRTNVVQFTKNKSGITSGVVPGATYNAFTANTGYIGLKFTSNGKLQAKYGTGGTWTDLGMWASHVQTGIGSSYYIKMHVASGDTLDSGTTAVDTYTSMGSDTYWSLTYSGVPKSATLDVIIATSSGGDNAILGHGTIRVDG